jgi:hypothetical protein
MSPIYNLFPPLSNFPLVFRKQALIAAGKKFTAGPLRPLIQKLVNRIVLNLSSHNLSFFIDPSSAVIALASSLMTFLVLLLKKYGSSLQ